MSTPVTPLTVEQRLANLEAEVGSWWKHVWTAVSAVVIADWHSIVNWVVDVFSKIH